MALAHRSNAAVAPPRHGRRVSAGNADCARRIRHVVDGPRCRSSSYSPRDTATSFTPFRGLAVRFSADYLGFLSRGGGRCPLNCLARLRPPTGQRRVLHGLGLPPYLPRKRGADARRPDPPAAAVAPAPSVGRSETKLDSERGHTGVPRPSVVPRQYSRRRCQQVSRSDEYVHLDGASVPDARGNNGADRRRGARPRQSA